MKYLLAIKPKKNEGGYQLYYFGDINIRLLRAIHTKKIWIYSLTLHKRESGIVIIDPIKNFLKTLFIIS